MLAPAYRTLVTSLCRVDVGAIGPPAGALDPPTRRRESSHEVPPRLIGNYGGIAPCSKRIACRTPASGVGTCLARGAPPRRRSLLSEVEGRVVLLAYQFAEGSCRASPGRRRTWPPFPGLGGFGKWSRRDCPQAGLLPDQCSGPTSGIHHQSSGEQANQIREEADGDRGVDLTTGVRRVTAPERPMELSGRTNAYNNKLAARRVCFAHNLGDPR